MFRKEIISDNVSIKLFGFSIYNYYITVNNKIFLPILFKRLLKFIIAIIPIKEYRKKVRNSIDYVVGKTKIVREPLQDNIFNGDIFAYIRVRNEMPTLEQSLNSILPIFRGGVIAYNDCSDGSDLFIENFCRKNISFIPAKYPYSFNDFPNLSKNENMVKYSNFALEFLPKDVWVMKVDVDQIYIAEKIKQNLNCIEDINDCVIPTRIQLHYDGVELYVLKNNPFLDGTDHWILYNRHLRFLDCNPDDKRKEWGSSHENLSNTGRRFIYNEVSNYHFPFLKKTRSEVDYNNLTLFDDFVKNNLMDLRKHKTYICDEKLLFNREYIMNFVKKFKL